MFPDDLFVTFVFWPIVLPVVLHIVMHGLTKALISWAFPFGIQCGPPESTGMLLSLTVLSARV